MVRLLVVRHAESEWNAAGRWQGRGDPPLSVRGREQAAAAAQRLDGLVVSVVASTLHRSRETAEIVAGALRTGPVRADEDLVEIDVGAWTGLTSSEVEARYPGELAAWREGRLSSPPGGEDREAFLARVVRALRRIDHEGPVLVVTHGGCIGRLERHLGVFPGRGPGHLAGRWFERDASGLSPHPDRVDLLGEPTPAPPEAQ